MQCLGKAGKGHGEGSGAYLARPSGGLEEGCFGVLWDCPSIFDLVRKEVSEEFHEKVRQSHGSAALKYHAEGTAGE